MNKFLLMFVMLLGSFTYAQTSRTIELESLGNYTVTVDVVQNTHDWSTFIYNNGVEVHHGLLNGLVEDYSYYSNHLTTITNLVNDEIVKVREARIEHIKSLAVTNTTIEIIPDTTFVGDVINISYEGATNYNIPYRPSSSGGYIEDYHPNSLFTIYSTIGIWVTQAKSAYEASLLDPRYGLPKGSVELRDARANTLKSFADLQYPILFDVTIGDFPVNTGGDGVPGETIPSWGIQYYFSFNGIAFPLLQTVYGMTNSEFSKLEDMRYDQFEDFLDAFISQTEDSASIADVRFDFDCN